MEISELKNIIETNYDINITDIVKVKNTYKINSHEGEYGVKIIKYDFPHFYFIISAINHLQKRDFKTIPKILKTKSNKDYVKIDENYAYVTPWVSSRVSNFNNPLELAEISKKIAELHQCSKGFNLNYNMKPRIGWFSWIKVFNTRCNEILDFKKRIYQKAYKSEFDIIYLKYIEDEINRGIKAVEGLKSNNYMEIMNEEVKGRGFCHHDLAHHNILVDEKGDINIIDFDYCILDSHLHDLASLLIRAMKDGKWSKEKCDLILDNYSSIYSVTKEDLNLIKYFIMFPQSFWQIGLQYYWEQQPWSEENFVGRISRYIEDREYRDEFLMSYFK